jgi:hypothetical protein
MVSLAAIIVVLKIDWEYQDMVAPGRPVDLNGVGLDMVKTGSRMIGVLQQHR